MLQALRSASGVLSGILEASPVIPVLRLPPGTNPRDLPFLPHLRPDQERQAEEPRPEPVERPREKAHKDKKEKKRKKEQEELIECKEEPLEPGASSASAPEAVPVEPAEAEEKVEVSKEEGKTPLAEGPQGSGVGSSRLTRAPAADESRLGEEVSDPSRYGLGSVADGGTSSHTGDRSGGTHYFKPPEPEGPPPGRHHEPSGRGERDTRRRSRSRRRGTKGQGHRERGRNYFPRWPNSWRPREESQRQRQRRRDWQGAVPRRR